VLLLLSARGRSHGDTNWTLGILLICTSLMLLICTSLMLSYHVSYAQVHHRPVERFECHGLHCVLPRPLHAARCTTPVIIDLFLIHCLVLSSSSIARCSLPHPLLGALFLIHCLVLSSSSIAWCSLPHPLLGALFLIHCLVLSPSSIAWCSLP
jgi:hypothetical protein